LWPYQFTSERAELTDKLANQIYDYSGGIPAYISKLLEEAREQAFTRGTARIDNELIAAAADYLAIQPPKELDKGTFLSDFRRPAEGYAEPVTAPGSAPETQDRRIPARSSASTPSGGAGKPLDATKGTCLPRSRRGSSRKSCYRWTWWRRWYCADVVSHAVPGRDVL